MVDFFGGDDVTQNPFQVTEKWIELAKAQNEPEPTAVHLATVDESGLPDVRVLYIRDINHDGFIFYTNYESAKGFEMLSGKAALNYYFPNWRRQIRVRGVVEKISEEASDAYFSARPEGSRLGAWMSQQSRPVASRAQMEEELSALDPALANERPPYWGGYIVKPLQIEFWAMGDFRVHDRFLWSRENLEQRWNVQRLYP